MLLFKSQMVEPAKMGQVHSLKFVHSCLFITLRLELKNSYDVILFGYEPYFNNGPMLVHLLIKLCLFGGHFSVSS